MKKMKITALLLALIMLLQPVLVSADAAGVSLEDYMGFINNAQNYGLIDSAYEYYVQQLEGKTVAERYQTLKSWHEGLLGDLFYENFIAYYEKAHAGENLVCVCGVPCEYGNIAHTNPACQWYFGNLPADEQAQIVAGLGEDERAEYLACLPTVEQELTADNGITVQGDLPVGAKLMAKEAAVVNALDAIIQYGKYDVRTKTLGYDIKVQWNGYDWQPDSKIYITIPDAIDDEYKQDFVKVFHMLDKAAAISDACDFSTDAALVAAFPAEAAAAKKAGYADSVAFAVQDNFDGNVTINDNGSVTFATDSFSLFYLSESISGEIVMVVGETITLTTNNSSNSSWSEANDNNNAFTISQNSSNRREVSVTANSTGTMTLRYGSNYNRESITVRAIANQPVKVYVYVAGYDLQGNPWADNEEFLEWLGIDASTIDDNDYFPIGEVELEPHFLTGKNVTSGSGLITSADEWPVLLSALSEIDTQALIGTRWDNTAYKDFSLNRGNNVNDYIDQIAQDVGQAAGSRRSALFYWGDGSRHSHGFADYDGISLHLDLRFETVTITFITGNNKITSGNAKDGTTVDHRVYINGSEVLPPRNLYIPDGYQFMGYYEDANFTIPWDGIGKPLNEDQTVYIKITEKENVVIHYVPVGNGTVSLDNEAVNPNTGNPQGSTATAGADSRFVGWYSDEACTKQVSTDAHYVPQKVNGEHVAATYYAKFELMTGDLVINKTVQDSTFTSGNRTFTFTVNGAEKTMTVPYNTKTGTVTFTDLVADDYTVTESHDGQYATTMGNINGTTTTVTINAGQTTTLDVVNTANAKMDVEVTKTWVDNNNNLGKRPETITVYLMNGSTQVASEVIKGDEKAATWTHTFKGVDKFDANGQEITYTVAEDAVNYYTGTPSGLKITNSITVGSLIVTKQVVDDANVYEGETRTFTFTVTGPDNYKYAQNLTFTNKGTQSLTFGNLTPGEYTVTESAYNGYDTTVDGVSGLTKKVLVVAGDTTTVAYVNTVMTKPVKVTKVWQDNGNELGVRPSEVTVELIASNTAYNKTITLKPADTDTENTAESWEGTIANVELYDVNGTELTYTVKEVTTNSNYATTYAPVDCKVDMTATTPSVTVTNSIKLGSLTITKTVVDPSGKYEDDLTFEFTVTGEHNYNEKRTVTVKKTDDYTGSVTIPQLLIGEYTVTETVPGNFTVKENNLTATVAENATATVEFENTVKTFTLTANKTWDEVNGDKSHRPASVTYTLTTGDEQFNDSVTIPAADAVTWTATKANLPVYTEDGTLITYTATETLDKASADFYVLDATSGYDVTATAEDATVSMTNVLKVGNLVIVKVIQDPSATYNASQEFDFTVNGETKTVTVAAGENTGTTTFENLTIGTYAVTETVPGNYDLTSVTVGNTAIENGGNVAITYDNAPQTTTVTFTNTVKTVDIPVTKIWVDESNKLGTRPDSIDLTLTGKVGETAVVTKTQQLTADNAVSGNANQWEFTFEKLPVYTVDGDLITYMVDEAPVEDYKKSINGFEITNTLLSTTLTITKAGCDETLDAGQSFLFRVTSTNGVDLIIAINGNGSETISGLLVGDEVTVTEIEGWSWRYTGTAQTITLEDGENTVTITNTRDNPYWLDGDCYAENNFAKQGN